MNVKSKRGFDLSGIYTKEKAESGKIHTRFLARPSTIGFTSHRRTWGIKIRKNLMRTCLEYYNARSVSWAIRKASLQAEEGRDGHRASVEASKPFFVLEEPKRRLLRGYCRAFRPWGSLFACILGLRPKLRRGSLHQKRLCWRIERWDLVIIALKSMPRMETLSARLSRGPRKWFINEGDNPRNSIGADEHCRDIR